jgi:hypothetical protein
MSCDVAVSAAILLASFHPGAAPVSRPLLIPAVAEAGSVNPLAREPLYAEIVSRADSLESRVKAYREGMAGGALPGFDVFKTDVAALSALDMKGHLDLAARGTDGDLKCILKGISQDLPRKLADVEAAGPASARDAALKEMFYLLRDNVEVITTPPSVTSGS